MRAASESKVGQSPSREKTLQTLRLSQCGVNLAAWAAADARAWERPSVDTAKDRPGLRLSPGNGTGKHRHPGWHVPIQEK